MSVGHVAPKGGSDLSTRTAGMSVDLCPLSSPVGYTAVHVGCWAPSTFVRYQVPEFVPNN